MIGNSKTRSLRRYVRLIRVSPRLNHGKIVADFRNRFHKEEVPEKKLLE